MHKLNSHVNKYGVATSAAMYAIPFASFADGAHVAAGIFADVVPAVEPYSARRTFH